MTSALVQSANAAQAASQTSQPTAKSKVKPQRKGKAKKAGTIAASIIAGLNAGKSPQKVLELVQKKHAGCKTTIACVYWYASRIKRGLIKAK